MTTAILNDALGEFLARGDLESLTAALAGTHPADIANFLAGLEPGEAVRVLALLPLPRQAAVFGYCEPDDQVAMAALLSRANLAAIVGAMSHDERADLFNRLPRDQQDVLLPGIAHAEREDIRKLSSYPEGTAGSVMTSDYVTLPVDITARAAIEKLRREAPDKETIYDSYIVDDARRLVGVISLRDLLLARDEDIVGQIMRRDVIFARAGDSREEVAAKIARYDLLALPIINGGDMLVGIVTADDAMDVQADAAEDDFSKIAAIQHGHRGGSQHALTGLKDAGVFLLYRMRVVWLVILVFGNLFSGEGIAFFEDTIKAHVALVFFLPLLIDSGGNAGSQSATLMVRALATGQVRMEDWGRMIGREVLVAGLLGLTMALAVSVIGYVRSGPDIALVVAAAMVVIVLVGSTIGMSIPFVLSRLGLDPAAASAPLITSICDAAGVLIYFSIATAYLKIG
jgi:magnesium transporter